MNDTSTEKWLKQLERLVVDAKQQADNNNYEEVVSEMRQLVQQEQAILRQEQEQLQRQQYKARNSRRKEDYKKYREMQDSMRVQRYIPELEVSNKEVFCRVYEVGL